MNCSILYLKKMGRSKDCIFWHRNKQTIILFLLLLFLSFTHGRLQAEERAVSKLLEARQRCQLQKAYEQRKMEEKREVVKRSRIGSRPPNCAMKCRGCEDCEAIQVPVFSHGFLQRTRSRGRRRRSPFSTNVYYRGDEFSNYVPITWKCRCGIFLLNP